MRLRSMCRLRCGQLFINTLSTLFTENVGNSRLHNKNKFRIAFECMLNKSPDMTFLVCEILTNC